jgi:hypothetical protein
MVKKLQEEVMVGRKKLDDVMEEIKAQKEKK